MNLDGNWFKSGMGGQHELKFGFGYRKNPNRSEISFSGEGLVGVRNSADATSPTASVAWVSRPYVAGFEALLERLRGGHVHEGPPDAERGPAMGPPDGERESVDCARQPRLSRS